MPPFHVNFPYFWTIGTSTPHKDGHIARFHRGILKVPTSSSSYASNLGDPEEKILTTLDTTEPQRYLCKTSRVGQKWLFWPLYGSGSVIRSVGCNFSSGFPRPYKELELDIEIFNIPPWDRATRPFVLGGGANNVQKRGTAV